MLEFSDAKIKKMQKLAEQNRKQREQSKRKHKKSKKKKEFPTHISSDKVEKTKKKIRNKVFRKEFLITYEGDNSFISGEDVIEDGVVVLKAVTVSTIHVTMDFFEKSIPRVSDFSDREIYIIDSLRLDQSKKLKGVIIKRIV